MYYKLYALGYKNTRMTNVNVVYWSDPGRPVHKKSVRRLHCWLLAFSSQDVSVHSSNFRYREQFTGFIGLLATWWYYPKLIQARLGSFVALRFAW